MSRRIHRWLINLLLLCGSVVFTIMILEVLLRVTGLQTTGANPPPIYRRSADPAISYELKPNMRDTYAFRSRISTNSLGFRSPEIDAVRPAIAVLGDSVTFGYGVENHETIAARLEAQLPGYNVINAGVNGYHLGQELATYRSKIRPLSPSIVILVFYPNDFQIDTGWLDDRGILQSQFARGTEQPLCAPVTTGMLGWLPGKCWFDQHSALYRIVKKVSLQRAGNTELARAERDAREHPLQDSVTDAQFTAYGKQLEVFASLIPPAQKSLFVIWPDRELHFLTRPKLKALAQSHGFAILDLYEVFGNHAKTLGWDTVHPSPKTIDEAAHVIAAVLKESGMVK